MEYTNGLFWSKTKPKTDLAKNIVFIAKKRNMSKNKLCEKSTISLTMIGFITDDTRNPSVKTLSKRAAALEVPTWYLLYPHDQLVQKWTKK